MKIVGMSVPKNFMDKGLENFDIDRLGDVVVIAGKNGAGKTRLLDIVYTCVQSHLITPSDYAILNENIRNHENALKNDPASPHKYALEKSIVQLRQRKTIDSYFKMDSRQDKYCAVKFVPNQLNFTSPSGITPKLKEASYRAAKELSSVDAINKHALAYIQYENENNFYGTHQDHSGKPESALYRESFNRLNDLVVSFLGTRIGMRENHCTLFDRSLENANLSDGQKVLLQLCVLIHAHGATLDNLIIILDEPENHLHPAAQIEFIKKIKEVLTNGQIWIATHSIHILSYLETSDIWYMQDNGIAYAGKKPEEVLNGLLGGAEQIERLQDFIGLPSVLAANQFAYECLFAPGTAMTGPEDRQTLQISAIIERLRDGREKVRVLDFGAGKGRLISAIYDNSNKPSGLDTWLDYVAFDEYPDDKADCENAIARAYGNSNNRYFNDKTTVLGCRDEGSFDVAVMCNVLHEISPNDWVSTFKRDSFLNRLLSDEGYLLIVEDAVIPKGERPNSTGFFILNRTEIKKLFAIPAGDSEFITESYNNENRLYAHLIPKRYLANATDDLKRESLVLLKSRCIDEIRRIRSNTDYKSGRILGLWSQQLANLVLFLE